MAYYVGFMIYIFIFFIGACIGSFLNVVIYRNIKEISIIYPPSFCPVCKTSIKWYDNIPILSYIILGGRCRQCRSEISISYPIIEVLTGFITLVFYLKWWYIKPLWFVSSCLVSYILIIVSVIDIKTMMLSDIFSYLLSFIGITSSFFNPMFNGSISERFLSSIYGIIIGASFMYILLTIGKIIYKKDAVGEGDVFLIGGIGSLVGGYGIFDIVLLSSFIGSMFSFFMIIQKKVSRHSAIPFGPFLAIGCVIKIFHPFSLFNIFFK